MQKAKERIQEVLPSYNEVITHSDDDVQDLKKDLNQICITYMPSSITMAEFEAIATTLHDIIINPYDYLNK